MIKAHRPRFKVATFGMFLATIIPRAKAIKEVSMALVAIPYVYESSESITGTTHSHAITQIICNGVVSDIIF
mgnify:CR=1 FL=1